MPTFKDRIVAQQPRCVFCGGGRPSETVDHVPSRIMFTKKARPKGLEFGACRPCNDATRKDELIVAFISRAFPNPINSDERAELKKIIRSALDRNPGLGTEMYADQVGVLSRLGERSKNLPTWNFINFGPITQSALRRFGYKLGAGLHYQAIGQILPVGGGVFTHIYTNIDAFTGGFPEEFTTLRGSTLAAGEWRVSDQFRYVSEVEPDGSISAHLVVFRESFALAILAAEKMQSIEGASPLSWQSVGNL